MSLRYRVISIGTLSRNRLWGETQAKRYAHATTTLVQDDRSSLLVDPSLPAEVLTQRLDERSGLSPDGIEAVFLTSFRPIHRRSLSLFAKATWLMHEAEIEAMRLHLDEMAQRAGDQADDEELQRLIGDERSLLERIEPAVEKITPQVHLFPAPGVTPGAAGLLLATATQTIVVAGDAVVTQDHYEAGQVYEQAVNIEQARESFTEIVEIADDIIPGHDNIFHVAAR
jgi:glyoxylase-like metal-dependent hydrolase (beta-lactamase superfamily II)